MYTIIYTNELVSRAKFETLFLADRTTKYAPREIDMIRLSQFSSFFVFQYKSPSWRKCDKIDRKNKIAVCFIDPYAMSDSTLEPVVVFKHHFNINSGMKRNFYQARRRCTRRLTVFYSQIRWLPQNVRIPLSHVGGAPRLPVLRAHGSESTKNVHDTVSLGLAVAAFWIALLQRFQI